MLKDKPNVLFLFYEDIIKVGLLHLFHTLKAVATKSLEQNVVPNKCKNNYIFGDNYIIF